MSYDLNDAGPQRTGELIPDGTFAKVRMTIRKGGSDGQSEFDRGLLRLSNTPGSDAKMLDCEFTVVEGEWAKRKVWQMYAVEGGKLDDKGVSKGWNISKAAFRAMIDSALGLDPDDMSEEAKTKRTLRGLADLDGITFIAKIAIEPANNPQYSDKNKIDRVVVPTDAEWRKVMDGERVAPRPSTRSQRKAAAPAGAASSGPAWASNGAATTQPTPPMPPQQPAAPAGGPAWLNG